MFLIRIFILSILFFNVNQSFATAQRPDYLIIENDTLKLHCNPLESYFESKPFPKELMKFNSSLWRSYIAYFKFENNKLIVEGLYQPEYFEDQNGNTKEKLVSIYEKIFGNKNNFECNFYNGVLICPLGEMKEYVHMSYSSIYENYKLFEIKNGVYQKEKKLTDKEFIELKIKHFQKFKETDEYKTKFEELLNASKESEEELNKMLGGISDEEKKRKKQNKYLYQKEKELEKIKMTEHFLFLFTSDNIKTIDIIN
ncbi:MULTISPECIES: hypothetical protein [unclassified Flavobacterium]|uniref:hypothetical protein n=1 Tax=unclassified Flavobacterium TaxID=196869 RepID=UPI003622E03D